MLVFLCDSNTSSGLQVRLYRNYLEPIVYCHYYQFCSIVIAIFSVVLVIK